MSASDAASLLLGVCTPGESTKAAETVRIASPLRLERGAELPNGVGIFLEDYENELGLRPGETLHNCLTLLLERLIDPPEAAAPRIEPSKTAPSGRRSFDMTPFKFRGDTWPSSVELEIARNTYGLRAHLKLRVRGGELLKLTFSPNGEHWIVDLEKGALARESRGKHSSITLLPEVAHGVVSCLRGGQAELSRDNGGIDA